MAFFSIKEIVNQEQFWDALNNLNKVLMLHNMDRIPESIEAGMFKTAALRLLRSIYNVPTTKALAEVLLKEYSTKSSIPDESRDKGLLNV